jgi:hypothetical protein
MEEGQEISFELHMWLMGRGLDYPGFKPLLDIEQLQISDALLFENFRTIREIFLSHYLSIYKRLCDVFLCI